MKTKTSQKNPSIYGFIATFYLLVSGQCWAGVDDCLKAALNTANPDDLKKSAAFAYNHSSCLQNFVPPTLVPYVALSGSLDAANQSGALNKVGLGFNTYQQCSDNVNPGKAAVKQLAPVLKPVCSTLNMDCKMFEGQAADKVNEQLASEAPLLNLLPCSCAVATSGLGVEKMAKLVKETKQCGATLAQVGEALGDAAKGVYNIAGDGVELGKDAANEAIKLGGTIAKGLGSAACAVYSLIGGCKGTPPSYKNTATAICKAHQATLWAASKTQAPNDIFVQCNDGLYCLAQPGEDLRCMQYRTTAQRNNDIAQMKQWCPQREQELEMGYQQQCHDGLCKIAITNAASHYGVECMKIATEHESDPRPSAELGAEMKDWQGYRENLVLSKFDPLIIDSIRRDPKTTPVQLLATYQCRPFLGREEQSLCEGSGGFQVCKKLVDAGKIQRCQLGGGGEYPLPTIGKLTNIINASAITKAPAATDQAPIAITNGSRMRAIQPIAREETPLQVSDVFLGNAAQKGCRPLLGRRDQLLCDNQAGYDECVQAVNRNYIRQCSNAVNDEIFPAPARER
jgi:hypothetical protein